MIEKSLRRELMGLKNENFKNEILKCPECDGTHFQQIELSEFKKTDIKFDSPAPPLPEDRKYIYVCGQCEFVVTGEPEIVSKEIEVIVTKDSVGMKIRKLDHLLLVPHCPVVVCHTEKDVANLVLSGFPCLLNKKSDPSFLSEWLKRPECLAKNEIIEYGFNGVIKIDNLKTHIILLTKKEWEKHQEKILEGYRDFRVVVKEEK